MTNVRWMLTSGKQPLDMLPSRGFVNVVSGTFTFCACGQTCPFSGNCGAQSPLKMLEIEHVIQRDNSRYKAPLPKPSNISFHPSGFLFERPAETTVNTICS